MEWACAEGLPQNRLCVRVARHKHGRGLSDLRTAVQIAAAFKAHCKAGKDAATGRVMNCISDEVSFAVPSFMNAYRQHLKPAPCMRVAWTCVCVYVLAFVVSLSLCLLTLAAAGLLLLAIRCCFEKCDFCVGA